MAAAEERGPGSWLDADVNKASLTARKLLQDWDVTTPEQDAVHKAKNTSDTGSVVRTRFPPEPNGYLHIGHAKSMNMNFSLAFKKLGVPPERRETVFRYDDTNPEAECDEYIKSINEDVKWMGWTPTRTTYASEGFHDLYALAIKLIEAGNAYVCFQKSEEIEVCREVAKKHAQARSKGLKPGDAEWPEGDPCSPYRETSVEENLKLFNDMKLGKFDEGVACLRMKMDMTSSNLNMFDQVAYRVKYVGHPHIGDEWCIYPTYDFTHCVQDALEDIDFSICTLEFETRRESYYWLLHHLNLFKPMVYEMSRLNISYVVLSKRKLLKLINTGFFHGWDDPRMPTISGLRRRGYTASALNRFCEDIGVTRNENLIEYDRLQEIFRQDIDDTAKRCMAVLRPIKVTFTNFDDATVPKSREVADFPQKPEGESPTHTVNLTPTVYIDAADFRTEDDKEYYGLAPGKWVGLRYGPCIKCEEVKTSADGKEVLEIVATLANLPPDEKRPKGNIQWSPENGVTFEARLYDHLFLVPQVDDAIWEQQLNYESEVIITTAMVDPSILGADGKLPAAQTHFQFERIGVFVVDYDTNVEGGKLVMNRTAQLKASKPKSVEAPQKSAAEQEKDEKRKAEQRRQTELKKAMGNLDPKELFKQGEHVGKYSKYDDDGIPTHDAAGEALAKSAIKKLKKDMAKQVKTYTNAQKKK